ncbi:MAG: hypothetical protein EWV55_01565 [Microcystis viridis Mv_BB_P_19951000_S69]|nr:MAG: hypothetical protein EWV47_04725 [Microcystis viridis Mv_BB_P_19951000_S68]TRU78963.1 MAG: hypothetical protein EWV55_01565 [Microcystis viridis Mv_BB_P_19951000_S69]
MSLCHLAGLILLQSDFQSWDIIPTQVPYLNGEIGSFCFGEPVVGRRLTPKSDRQVEKNLTMPKSDRF